MSDSDIDALRRSAFDLAPDEQFRLATFIAENVGYVLTAEASFDDIPRSPSQSRTFFQSHECAGYRAKVTIEWSMPKDVDADLLPAWRTSTAEDIADSVLAFSGRKMRDMVQAMRGYTVTPADGGGK
jgi:hypothetical protein